jgi:selenide,water dikinase
LCHLNNDTDENLLVGMTTSDDASVYKISEELALVQTLDFFTPVVDDPYLYGQIAAANSLSDVYAMGGEPKLALNITCFPSDLPKDIIKKILQGGHDKVKEANALVIGGHTVEDKEPKYGLSVTGFIHPKDLVTNSNAKPGDVLILTKPLGLGILNTGIKAGIVSEDGYKTAVSTMTELNKFSKDAMMKVGVNICTDITGFGLLGHAYEMAEGSDVTIKFCAHSIPIIEEALSLARMGIIPAGAYRNMDYIKSHVKISDKTAQEIIDCMTDPQTSGGLLISVEKNKSEMLLNELKKSITPYGLVGEVLEKQDYRIIVE